VEACQDEKEGNADSMLAKTLAAFDFQFH